MWFKKVEIDPSAKESCRLYNCGFCGDQVLICSKCDRGNRYCSVLCRQGARRKTMRLSSGRFQKTFRGRKRHAKRQHQYRRSKKVTHHSSITQKTVLDLRTNSCVASVGKCSHCGRSTSIFIRYEFLGRRITRRDRKISRIRGPTSRYS